MYPFVLAVHNLVRWAVVIAGILAVGKALLGWLGKKEWSKQDRLLGVIFSSSMDTQLLLGLLLYFVFSPITKGAFTDFGAAMNIPDQRFFALEHVFYMIFALVFAHLGSMLPKKVDDSQAKFKRATLWFSLALLIILIGIPWWRPLFPGL
jgi:ABC-type Mn2+/Zn2+ transport system permease subunit